MEVEPESISKSAQKKLNKKLKAEGGKAVASGDAVEEKGEEKKSKKDKKKEKAATAEVDGEKKTYPSKTLEGGLKFKDTTIGAGPMAKKGNDVSMRYIGKLPDGHIFDQNTKGKPVSCVSSSHIKLLTNI